MNSDIRVEILKWFGEMTFILFIPTICALAIGFSAWLAGLFVGDEVLKVLSIVGIKTLTMWDIGCFVGFFGGLVYNKPTSKEKAG